MLAKDVMTSPVISVAPKTPVTEIAKILSERRISAVPVVDAGNRILGIVSEGDLIRRAEVGTVKERGSWWLTAFAMPEHLAREYSKTHGRRAEDVMTRDVVSVGEDTPIAEIAQCLEHNGIKRVPVLRDSTLVGIVSRANLLQALASAKHGGAPVDASDAAIREQVLETLRHEPWVQRAILNATVEDGVVHLWGLANTEQQLRATEIAAKETAGVKSVRNHMSVSGPEMYYGE